MKTTLVLYASWRDPKLANLTWKFESLNIIGNSIDNVWKPDIVFDNAKDVDIDSVSSEARTMRILNRHRFAAGVYYISRFARNFTKGS